MALFNCRSYRRVSKKKRGKQLRSVLFIVKKNTHGLQGRLLGFQQHPFECLSNSAGTAALRCNLDVQDLRRVLPPEQWMAEGDQMPHIGDRPDWGLMNHFEWNGEEYEERPSLEGTDPVQWDDELRPEDWRDILLDLAKTPADDESTENILDEAVAAFSDGINTGFYINSYTTKHCPTMEGVLDELRKGIERLEDQRRQAKEEQEANGLTSRPKAKSPFAETLATLMRLNSSYRRCYWKSGSEMVFPILFGHMTFASHRCWASIRLGMYPIQWKSMCVR